MVQKGNKDHGNTSVEASGQTSDGNREKTDSSKENDSPVAQAGKNKPENTTVEIEQRFPPDDIEKLYLFLILTVYQLLLKSGVLQDINAELTATHVQRLVDLTVDGFNLPGGRVPQINKYRHVADGVISEMKGKFGNKMKTMLILEDLSVEDIIVNSIQEQTIKWLDRKPWNIKAIVIACITLAFVIALVVVAAVTTGGFKTVPFYSVFLMLSSVMGKLQ